jgi:hypothetical protein
MTIATKVAVLLGTLRRQDVEELPPVERRRFADLCRYVARLAETQNDPPKAGALYPLKAGRREE